MKHLPKNIAWSIVKNISCQIIGRMFLSLARFGIAILIVRQTGLDRYGEYSLVLSILLIAEWLTDFGTSDITVRNICQQPERKQEQLNALSAIKGVQIIVAPIVLIFIVQFAQFQKDVSQAILLAGSELFFIGGMLIYRVLFRVNMVMERDIFSEVTGTLIMLPGLWLASLYHYSLNVLVGAYVLSRLLFFVLSFILGRKDYIPSPRLALRADLISIVKASWPLGLTGLLVCLYETIEPIMLAKMQDSLAVGHYSTASRFLLPIIISCQAITNTVFPLLSSYWNQDMEKFRTLLQGAFNTCTILGIGMCCFFYNSSDFFMRIFGKGITEGVSVLKILSWTIITHTLATILSPLVIITGYQRHALWLVTFALSIKIVFLLWLIPSHGAIGAAWAHLFSGIIAGTLPTLLFTKYVIGIKLNYKIPFKAGVSLSLSLLFVYLLNLNFSLLRGIVATVFFITFAFVLKAISVDEMKFLARSIKNRTKYVGA